jgi:hypothetical protein
MPAFVDSDNDEGSDSADLPQEEGQKIGHPHEHHAPIGMCCFHVKDALDMKTNLLPKGKQDAGLMLRGVRILSETDVSDFMLRWTIYKAKRKEWCWNVGYSVPYRRWDVTHKLRTGGQVPNIPRLIGKGKMADELGWC